MLQELHKLQVKAAEDRHQAALAARPFAHLGHNNREVVDMEGKNGITVLSRGKKRVSGHLKENGNMTMSCFNFGFLVKAKVAKFCLY
jgi:hypothetical protein